MRNRLVIFVTIRAYQHCLGPDTECSFEQRSIDRRSVGRPAVDAGDGHVGRNSHDMHDMSKDMPMADSDKDADRDASAHVMNSMEGHMDMGPHMKMTALRPPKPGDAARAQKVADEARKASRKIHGLSHRAGRWLQNLSSRRAAKDVPLHQLWICDGSGVPLQSRSIPHRCSTKSMGTTTNLSA